MGKIGGIERTEQPRGIRLALSGRDAWLDVDPDTLAEHKSNLEMRLAEANDTLKRLQDRLENKSYLEKAPKTLVDESKRQLTDTTKLVERLQAELKLVAH